MSGQTGSLKKTLTRFSTNMLVRTILLPSVFTSIPEDQASLYNSVISLLQNLEKNGVVLIDDNNCIKQALSQGVSKWPVKFRQKAQKLLVELNKKGRLVELSLNGEMKSSCGEPPCHNCMRMAKLYLPPAIIANNNCKKCASNQLASVSTVEVVDVAEYSISNFFDVHLNQGDRLILNSEWTQKEFEEEILIPLLRDAKDVKIYDRYIGRSILTENAAKYKLTIEWIINVFVRERGSKLNGVFEVYGGLGNLSIRSAEIPRAVSELRNLETDMQKRYPKFKLIIKKETQNSQMPHDRFLITNQVAISIGRGFDLLLEKRQIPYPRRIRDVTIAYCSEPGKIEQAVRSLPDLP